MDCRNLRDRPRGLPPPLPKLLKGGKSNYSCRRVSGRLPGESLRKLRPSSRSAGSYEHGRETGQWHRNDTSRLARGCGDAEVVPTRMKRPIRGMQGQTTADERLLKAGGSPLSSMSPENRRRVTTDTPASLSLPLSGLLGLFKRLIASFRAFSHTLETFKPSSRACFTNCLSAFTKVLSHFTSSFGCQ